MIFEIPDQMISDDLVWINVNGIGAAVADRLEAQGLPVNRLIAANPVYTCPACGQTTKSSIADPRLCGRCGSKLSAS
jgi:rRNA maturation endonuclease Nob1